MMLSLSKSVTAFCKENPKTTSSKVCDSLREKAPKAIAENCYCAIFWYVLQDLCARVGNQNAAWLSNGGDFALVNLPYAVTLDLLEQLLPSCDEIFANRIEYSSLIQFIVPSLSPLHSSSCPLPWSC